ncbi:hypothetical protein [Streptomyces sp. NPDC049970]|uniref:hypothetical protein n=1 Tax=Streptomyces sp. NPDC049970 TaxID=3155033 RepID=UPI00341BC350
MRGHRRTGRAGHAGDGVSAPVLATVTAAPAEDACADPVAAAAYADHHDSRSARHGTTARPGRPCSTLPPARQVPRSARFARRTPPDPTAGPAESHSTVPVDGTWTESAVTHSTRPTLSTSVPGTMTGATRVSTDHSVDLAATAPDGALGSVSSLAPTSGGTGSIRFWPSEATAALRPQLVLTFGDE